MSTENMSPVDAARAWLKFPQIGNDDWYKATAFLYRHLGKVPGDPLMEDVAVLLSAEVSRLRELTKHHCSDTADYNECLDERDALRSELAALSDGFDPKVKLPKMGASVLGQISTGYTFVCHYDGNHFIQFGAREPVTRWWPIPSNNSTETTK